MNTHEKAITWWESLSLTKKIEYAKNRSFFKRVNMITGREIEQIYLINQGKK